MVSYWGEYISLYIANVGLTKIIMYSTPVLMFIYPLAITLILLALLSPLFKHSKIVYRFTTLFTMVAAFVDGVKASQSSLLIQNLHKQSLDLEKIISHSLTLVWDGLFQHFWFHYWYYCILYDC